MGSVTRSDIEKLFKSISKENKLADQYIINNVKGKLISGNHRFVVKEWVRENKPEDYAKKAFWNLTLTQLYIGLSPKQSRYLAKVDNEKERVQAADTMSSMLKVRTSYLSLNIMRYT